jgi:hypothetical protein
MAKGAESISRPLYTIHSKANDLLFLRRFGHGLPYGVEDLIVLDAAHDGELIIDKDQRIVEISLRHLVQQRLATLLLLRIHRLEMLEGDAIAEKVLQVTFGDFCGLRRRPVRASTTTGLFAQCMPEDYDPHGGLALLFHGQRSFSE